MVKVNHIQIQYYKEWYDRIGEDRERNGIMVNVNPIQIQYYKELERFSDLTGSQTLPFLDMA